MQEKLKKILSDLFIVFNDNKYIKLLKLFYLNFKDTEFFDIYVRETIRTFLKRVGYFTRLLGFNWETLFSFYVKLKKYIPIKFFSLLWKYILVFCFIIWIIGNSLLFRFYLIDTPMDAKMPIERKEFETTKTWRRYIPVALFESMFFVIRPFWKVFGTLRLVFSNIAALRFLVIILLEEDFMPIFRSIVINKSSVLNKSWVFFKNNFYFFYNGVWRILGFICSLSYNGLRNCIFIIYLIFINYPFKFLFGIVDFLLLGIFKLLLINRLIFLPVVIICVYLDNKGESDLGDKILATIYNYIIYKVNTDDLFRRLLFLYNRIVGSMVFKILRFILYSLIVLFFVLFYLTIIMAVLL